MIFFNSNVNKWFRVLIPLTKEIQRISYSSEDSKEKLFLIKLTLNGAQEDLKLMASEFIENKVFSEGIKKAPDRERFLLNKFDMEFQIHLN